MDIIQVGMVCGTPVYVTKQEETAGLYCTKVYAGLIVGVALRVVKKDGTPLTLHNIEQMHVADDDIQTFANLCSEKVQTLARIFLPEGTDAPMMHPASCFFDEEDKVHVLFLISGFVRP